ncbi:MAG: hypothetical protein ABIS67_00865, partial [Candidatus Eisenbacteria bacterium]
MPPAEGLTSGSRLLTGASDPRVESRRIALGLVALAAISIVLLNFGILSGARERLARERWAQISATLEAKREDVRELLWQFQRQAEFVAGQPQLTAWIRSALEPVPAPVDASVLQDELARAARTFDYRSVRVVAGDGRVVASNTGAPAPLTAGERGLALGALTHRRSRMSDVRDSGALQQNMMLAVPAPAAELGVVLLFEGNLDEALLPLLMSWRGFGADAGAYLVKREGEEIVIVTAPPANLGV